MNDLAFPRKIDAPSTPVEDIPTYDVHDLISDGVQARLMLDGQCYFLRITRAGNLILTK